MTALQSAFSFRKLWRDVSGSFSILAADNHSVTPLRLITCLPGYSIFVQKINVSVTGAAATDTTIQSSNATPVVLVYVNNAFRGGYPWDFDEAGVQLAEGEHLNYVNSAAGARVILFVQAYMKPIGPLVAKTAGTADTYHTL